VHRFTSSKRAISVNKCTFQRRKIKIESGTQITVSLLASSAVCVGLLWSCFSSSFGVLWAWGMVWCTASAA
jgi:hypothetical protein